MDFSAIKWTLVLCKSVGFFKSNHIIKHVQYICIYNASTYYVTKSANIHHVGTKIVFHFIA